MSLAGLLLLVQAVHVPVAPGPPVAAPAGAYSIVIARAVSQSDPRPIDCGEEFCTSWFLGRFDRAETLAGEPLPAEFDARIEMGSPYISQYRLLMIVAPGPDGELRVHASEGFHGKTGVGCLSSSDWMPLQPEPQGSRLFRQHRSLCAKDE